MNIQRATKLITVEFFPFVDMTSDQGRGLIQQAIAARHNAQAPYSHFKVGAALWSEVTRTMFYGCNVECADFSGTTHAEQAALASMVSAGHKKVSIIAIAAAHEDIEFDLSCRHLQMPTSFSVRDMIPPCGGCLQKIWENCHGDLGVTILSVAPNGLISRTIIGDIFPVSFDLSGVYK